MSETQLFLLAAGRGKRAGGPKAWKEVGGRPALENMIEGMLPHVAAIFVSVQAEWKAGMSRPSPKVSLISVDPDQPMLASLQELIASRGSDLSAFLHHVDMPVPDAGLLAALSAALGQADAAVPLYKGERGHPALLSRKLYDAILDLDPQKDRLDQFLRTRNVVEVPVEQASVLENQNT